MKICRRCHGKGYTVREDAQGNEGEIRCEACKGYGYEQEVPDDSDSVDSGSDIKYDC